MERKGAADFLADVAEEEADAAPHLDDLDETEEEKLRDDLGYFMDAWGALRYDRFYGAFGGESTILYISISAYARDHGIAGDDFHVFKILIREMDREYLEYVERNRPKKPDNEG